MVPDATEDHSVGGGDVFGIGPAPASANITGAENQQPHVEERRILPYGSVRCLSNVNIGSNRFFACIPVDVSRDTVKTFGVRGNQIGSWFLRYNFGLGSRDWLVTEHGTFPASSGSVKTVSFTEAVQLAQIVIRTRATAAPFGSYSVWYGGRMDQYR